MIRHRIKAGRCLLVAIVVLMLAASLLLASCIGASTTAQPERMPAAVVAIPNVAAPRANVQLVGANFEPHERVKIALVMVRGPEEFAIIETIIRSSYAVREGEKEPLVEVDGHGSFQLKMKIPKEEGVWPIRVYNEKGKMIASTLIVVAAPAEEK